MLKYPRVPSYYISPADIKELTHCKRGNAREFTHNVVPIPRFYPIYPGQTLWSRLWSNQRNILEIVAFWRPALYGNPL